MLSHCCSNMVPDLKQTKNSTETCIHAVPSLLSHTAVFIVQSPCTTVTKHIPGRLCYLRSANLCVYQCPKLKTPVTILDQDHGGRWESFRPYPALVLGRICVWSWVGRGSLSVGVTPLAGTRREVCLCTLGTPSEYKSLFIQDHEKCLSLYILNGGCWGPVKTLRL